MEVAKSTLYMHMIKTKINVKWILKKLSLLNS